MMNKQTGSVSLLNKLKVVDVSSEVSFYSLSLLLFLISVVYFYFFGKGLIFFQENNSLFIFSSDYLKQFTAKPGGLLIYAAGFLTQFYYVQLAASVIISLLIFTICLVINRIIRILNDRFSFSAFFVLLPACGLMLLQTRYDFRLYHILGFLLVLAWFLLYLLNDSRMMRILIISIFPLVYYIAGSFVLVFIGLFLVYNLLKQKGNLRFILSGYLIAISVATFFIFRDYLFYQPSFLLLRFPLLINDTSRLTKYLTVLSVFFILIPLFTMLKNERRLALISGVALFPLIIFMLLGSYDKEADSVMGFEKMIYMHNWDGVIRENEKLQSSNIVVQYYYNLALSEKGELCSRMFFGKQSSGSTALTLSRDDEYSSRSMYFYYAIGLSGEAHHLAYEQMVQHGYRPENIKMLIRTEMIRADYRVAERYINVLKKTLHYKHWAEKYEKMLNRTDLVLADPELGLRIRQLPRQDFFVVTDDFQNLDMLVKDNPYNRVALEYKIAKLLLEKDLMELGSEIRRLKDAGYSGIPRHIEEAIVSLVNVTKEFPDMGGLKISRDTDQRFLKYFSDIRPFRGDRKLAEKGIKKTDKNTFWYYLQFGLLRNNNLKKGPADNSIY